MNIKIIITYFALEYQIMMFMMRVTKLLYIIVEKMSQVCIIIFITYHRNCNYQNFYYLQLI